MKNQLKTSTPLPDSAQKASIRCLKPELQIPEPLLNSDQTASILGFKEATLAQMRWRNDKRLPWVKLGKAVRYKVSDIQAFIDANTVNG